MLALPVGVKCVYLTTASMFEIHSSMSLRNAVPRFCGGWCNGNTKGCQPLIQSSNPSLRQNQTLAKLSKHVNKQQE